MPVTTTVVDGYTIYTKWVIFEGNNYTNNYASNAKGIITIKGTPFVILKSEILINNGDMFNEKLSEYSS